MHGALSSIGARWISEKLIHTTQSYFGILMLCNAHCCHSILSHALMPLAWWTRPVRVRGIAQVISVSCTHTGHREHAHMLEATAHSHVINSMTSLLDDDSRLFYIVAAVATCAARVVQMK